MKVTLIQRRGMDYHRSLKLRRSGCELSSFILLWFSSSGHWRYVLSCEYVGLVGTCVSILQLVWNFSLRFEPNVIKLFSAELVL